jgi:excisionase family DNA binding protein
MPCKEWFNVSEAAKYLGVSRPTLYKLMDGGGLPYYVLEGVQGRRLKKEDLDALFKRVDEPKKETAP